MRTFVLGVLVSTCFVSGAAYAAACRLGERVTITNVITAKIHVDGDNWFFVAPYAKPCPFSMIAGKGKLPANCVEGKTMTATGVVAIGDNNFLEVEAAHCK